MARDGGGAVFTTAFNSTRVRGAAPDATARDAVGKGPEPAIGRSRSSPARSSLYLPSSCSTVPCTTRVRLAPHCAASPALANSRVEESGGTRQRPLPRALEEEEFAVNAIDREADADGLFRHPLAKGRIRLADLHPEHGPPLEGRCKPTARHVVPGLGEDRATRAKRCVEPCDVRTRRTSSARRCRSVFLPVPRWERRTIRHSRSPSGAERVSRGRLKRSGEPRMPRPDNRRTDRSPLPADASGRPGVTPRIEARKCARYRWDRSLRRPRDLARQSRGGYSGGANRHTPAARNIHPSRDDRRRASVPHGEIPIRATSRPCRARPNAASQSRSSRLHCVSPRVCRTPRRADPARRAEAAGAEPKNSAAAPVGAASDAKACHDTRCVKAVRRDSTLFDAVFGFLR